MKARLICYSLGKADHAKRSAFKREFLGYVDRSNNGQYEYRREGLLTRIPNMRPIKSVVIVKEKDSSAVKRLLRRYRAKIKEFVVTVHDFK